MKSRKLCAALAVRNRGSRLYGKPLQNLDVSSGVKIIDNIIECLRTVECIDNIVLGIANGSDVSVFKEYALSNELAFIKGDEIDVLSRLIQCGNSVGATDIFRVTSESPFHHLIKLLTHGIAIAKKKQMQLFMMMLLMGVVLKLSVLKH